MSSHAVDAALSLPPDQVVAALSALPEDQRFERKSARIKAKDLAIALVAMGNAEGGTIVVGLHDGRAETPTPTCGRSDTPRTSGAAARVSPSTTRGTAAWRAPFPG